MNYQATAKKLDTYRGEIAALREKIRAVQAEVEPEEVQDYVFQNLQGPIKLSQLFGDRRDLIVIHNMGIGCSACTMWADGFNGVYDHLRDRAAFALSSPNAPDVQAKFAAERGWRFPMVSHTGTSFAADMGYVNAKGNPMPGVSAFHRDGGKILRMTDTRFHPADEFCTVWRFFDLLPEGAGSWHPKCRYG
jgi:predicted dithiol-disulfide oxidoreductase (DUF899 family)